MIEILKPNVRQYLVVLTVNLSAFTSGMNFAWPSPMLVKLGNDTQTILPYTITTEEGSWIVSIEFSCALIYNTIVAVLLDRIGRKYCVLLGVIPKVTAVLLYIFATEVWMIIFGRALQGLADSFVFIGIPVYISEIATKEKRGALGAYLQIFSSLGIVVTLSAGPFLSYLLYNIIFVVVISVTSIPLLFLPESPYFLLSKGREDEAIKVLTFLRGSEVIAKHEIKECTTETSDEKLNKMAVLRSATVRKTLVISIIFSFGAQLVGYNAVSYYLQTVLISTNTSVMPEIASVIIGLVQLFSSVCTLFVSDKFGRKIILITTLAGMCIGLIGLGAFFKFRPVGGVPILGFLNYLPLISIVVIVFCYNAGVGSLLWIILAELFDGPARAFGMSCSIAVNMTLIFVTTKYFPILLETAGPAETYWSFAGVSVSMCLFIILCVPETKGKTFDQIQKELGRKRDSHEEKDSTIL